VTSGWDDGMMAVVQHVPEIAIIAATLQL